MSRKGRIVLAILGLAVIGAGAFKLFERPLAEYLVGRVIDANVGTDPSAALPDGLHAYVCGTGSPMADTERAGACIAVIAGDTRMIFDVGSGSMRVLGRMGFPVGKTERLFLTHLHSDHFDGLGELMVQSWVQGARATPLPVSGPPGTIAVAEGFNAAYALDATYRTAHHGAAIANPAGAGLAPEEIVIPPGAESVVVLKQGDLTVTAIRVSHEPVKDAYGYRVDYKGRSIAISGDTAYDPRFARAAKGVDVLFHEALDRELVGKMRAAAQRNGSAAIAKVMADIPGYHASPIEAAKVAQMAGARMLVFYHTIPPMPFAMVERLFLDGTDAAYDGPIRISRDGDRISLPAGGTATEYENVLF
ncbi:MBL fold metallo-hydrolase [Erythrobacter oryzae]|uniref:MBL fold metallo-hydrolase n=1 Tax=Erythrobacter oryzae TaxID=3019556 RepID=UPI002552A0FB|nr:MBL fold metallo-hydrolase [Erythrobacter sp. COR-2]